MVSAYPHVHQWYPQGFNLFSMHLVTSIATVLSIGQGVSAAFGLTPTTTGYQVDTDGGLIFEINKYALQNIHAYHLNTNIYTGRVAILPASSTTA
jgi:rhamnogalacturonan endolyase